MIFLIEYVLNNKHIHICSILNFRLISSFCLKFLLQKLEFVCDVVVCYLKPIIVFNYHCYLHITLHIYL